MFQRGKASILLHSGRESRRRIPKRRKPCVLVVDDEPGIAKTLSWLLEESGYRTAAALSGQAACEILESTAPDLAIVDVNLPDVQGLSVAAEICRRVPNCKLLLLSGETTAEVRRAIEKRTERRCLGKAGAAFRPAGQNRIDAVQCDGHFRRQRWARSRIQELIGHGAWDTGFIQHTGMSVDEYVVHLNKLIAYYGKEITVLDERLALAGLRLAVMLNEAFAHAQMPPRPPHGGRTKLDSVPFAEQQLPHKRHKLIKVSYDYLYYEPPFPFDLHAIYKLRAFRDDSDSCDESLSDVTQELGLKSDQSTSSTVIECWRTTPGDHGAEKLAGK
jgi:CheY-like chemotaxis protein